MLAESDTLQNYLGTNAKNQDKSGQRRVSNQHTYKNG